MPEGVPEQSAGHRLFGGEAGGGRHPGAELRVGGRLHLHAGEVTREGEGERQRAREKREKKTERITCRLGQILSCGLIPLTILGLRSRFGDKPLTV